MEFTEFLNLVFLAALTITVVILLGSWVMLLGWALMGVLT